MVFVFSVPAYAIFLFRKHFSRTTIPIMLNLVEMLVMTSGAVELYDFVIFCKKKSCFKRVAEKCF